MDYKELWKHHLELADTYMMLAKKYEFMNPQMHMHYYLKALEHANEMEKYFLTMQHTSSR